VISFIVNQIVKYRIGRDIIGRLFDFSKNKFHLTLKLLDIEPSIYLDVNSSPEVKYRITSVKREKTTMYWLSKLEKDAVLFDIGANVGCYSLIAAKKFDVKNICAFEPMPTNYLKCIQNVNQNNLLNHINVYPFAIDDENKIKTLSLSNNYEALISGSSGHQVREQSKKSEVKEELKPKICVNCFTIDHLNNIIQKKPNYIKIDVDGREFEILNGAKETLKSGHVKSLMVEINTNKEKIINFLSEYGYEISLQGEHGNTIFDRKI
tara:strand:+ start:479 stop:1273 length:795 start_codon:yes stop_codon:yes gene_type:complete